MTSFGSIYVAVASPSVRARVTVAILAISEGKKKVVVEVTPEEVTVNVAVAWGLKRALERLGDRKATLHTNLKAVVDLATTIAEHGAVESAEPFYGAVLEVVRLCQRTGSELRWMRSADEPMLGLRERAARELQQKEKVAS